MAETIFTKIIKKEIEAFILYEDQQFIAFLDNNPWTKGHALIVPKIEVERLSELPPQFHGKMMEVANEVSQLLEKKLHCKSFNFYINDGPVSGQEVPSVHMHIIPRYNKREIQIEHKELYDSLDKIYSIIKF